MFEGDLTTLTTTDLLESAAEHHAEENRCAARRLQHAQIFADRHHPDTCPDRPGRRSFDGRERAIVLGGDGCPQIAEFAIAEFGLVLGISTAAAARYLGQALALRHRFPFTWAKVLSGEATPWRAARIAEACLQLSEEAARSVDRRVAALVDSITPYRLDKIVTAAKAHADPDGARAEAEDKARERGVYIGRSDEHGTKTVYIRAASGAVVRFDAGITTITDALKTLGDTRTLQHRRAAAIEIMADPHYMIELLLQAHEHSLHHPTPTNPDTATDPSIRPAINSDTEAITDHHPEAPAARTDCDAGRAPDRHPQPAAARIDSDPATEAISDHHPELPAVRAGRDAEAALDHHSEPPAVPTDPDPEATTPDHHAQAPATRTDCPAGMGSAMALERGREGSTSAGLGTGSSGSSGSSGGDEGLLDDWVTGSGEPGLDDEADRDAPHPSASDLPDPLDAPFKEPVEPINPDPDPWIDPGRRDGSDDGEPLDAAAQRALHARLARIRHDAHTHPTSRRRAHGAGSAAGRLRPGKTEIFVHLTDHTLATGTGVVRVEGLGPLLAGQLTELVGHGPYVVKPVIDLNDPVGVDAYEIPERIRERVKLMYPVEQFPYGTRETHRAMDLDHIEPYDPLGPPGQTNTDNLAPLGRFPHRVKTHGRGWNVRRLDRRTLEWITPHGFTFHVGPTGTHRAPRRPDD